MPYERFTNKEGQLVLGITEELTSDHQMEEVDAELLQRGYMRDTDYEWGIAGGDDLPHCVLINSDKLKADEEALGEFREYEGMSVYDEEYGKDEDEE